MITSASAAASASEVTRSPASSALRRLELPSRRATRTSTPDSQQVQRVGVPLRAVAQDRHLAAGDQRGVGVGFVVQRGHVVCSFSLGCVTVVDRRSVAVQLRQGDPARPLELDDRVLLEQALEVVDLLGPARPA